MLVVAISSPRTRTALAVRGKLRLCNVDRQQHFPKPTLERHVSVAIFYHICDQKFNDALRAFAVSIEMNANAARLPGVLLFGAATPVFQDNQVVTVGLAVEDPW